MIAAPKPRLVDLRRAGSIEPCRAGTQVHLHIHTPEGEVLVHCTVRQFLLACRAPTDANGNPWPTLEQLDAEARREQEAATLPPPAAAEHPGRQGRVLNPDRRAAYERVLAVKIENRGKRNGAVRAACEREGVNYGAFSAWAYSQREVSA